MLMSNRDGGRHLGTSRAFIHFAHAQDTLSSSPGEFAPPIAFALPITRIRPSPQTLPGCPPGSVFLCPGPSPHGGHRANRTPASRLNTSTTHHAMEGQHEPPLPSGPAPAGWERSIDLGHPPGFPSSYRAAPRFCRRANAMSWTGHAAQPMPRPCHT
jgi:hypothetical protein